MFDPYYKWLGIPPKDQPPNHYRLFGLELYENDLEVIEGAIDRVMAFVRQYQSGEHAPVAAKLLNEIAAARLCLLKPASKAEYDAKLKLRLTPSEAAQDDTPPFPMDEEITQLVMKSKSVPKPVPKPVVKKKKSRIHSFPFEYLLVGIAVILILLPSIVLLWPGSKRSTRQPQIPAQNFHRPR